MNKNNLKKIILYVMDTVFKLPDEELLDYYLRIQEELVERGVINV